MKSIVLVLALLLCGSIAEAGPFGKVKNFVKEHKRFTTAALTIAGTSVYQWKASARCQSGDHEVCNLGYGAWRAFDGINTGLDVAMLFAAEGYWKQFPNGKFGYVLAYGFPTYQVVAGSRDLYNYKPEANTSSTLIPRNLFSLTRQ